MAQSPSWEVNWFAASQEIPLISRNPKVHYRTHKRLPPVSILGQPNPVHIPTSHLLFWYSSLTYGSFSLLKLNLCLSNLCVACLPTANLPLTNPAKHTSLFVRTSLKEKIRYFNRRAQTPSYESPSYSMLIYISRHSIVSIHFNSNV